MNPEDYARAAHNGVARILISLINTIVVPSYILTFIHGVMQIDICAGYYTTRAAIVQRWPRVHFGPRSRLSVVFLRLPAAMTAVAMEAVFSAREPVSEHWLI